MWTRAGLQLRLCLRLRLRLHLHLPLSLCLHLRLRLRLVLLCERIPEGTPNTVFDLLVISNAKLLLKTCLIKTPRVRKGSGSLRLFSNQFRISIQE